MNPRKIKMKDIQMPASSRRIMIAIGSTVFLLSACGPAETPVNDATIFAAATMTSAAKTGVVFIPSATSTLSPVPQESPTVFLTNTPAPSATRTVPVIISYCDDSAFVSDVTIPDGTVIAPGESFTKTWELKNTGTCEWSTAYVIAFISGNALGGSTTALSVSVSADEEVEISVKMVAPVTAGTYFGNWRLRNASGSPFGQLVYVQIVVPGGNGTVTSTLTATGIGQSTPPTSTPTATPTLTLEPTTG
jgi:hypothetical protein